jgi:hypothetical protein
VRPSGRGAGLLGLAVLLVLNTLLGPAALDVVDYPLPPTILHQLEGLELVTIGLVVPVLVLAAVLELRGRPEAPLVAFGPCAYASYMFVQYVVGPDRTELAPAVLLHLTVFATATALAAGAWTRAASTSWTAPEPARRRRWGVLLVALAGFVALRYLPLVGGALTDAQVPEEFASAPAFYWSVVLLDVGLVVPASAAAAVAVLRGSPLAVPATYAVVGWFALVPPSVAAMALVMVATDDEYASAATATLLSVVAVATLALAVVMFRRLLAGAHRRSTREPVLGPREQVGHER